MTVELISDTLIREAARRLGQAARNPARVILLGSYARGEPDAGSDVDFLVVQQDGFSRRREAVRLQEALSPLRIPAEVLVVSDEEAAQPERSGDVVRDALAEGVVLYEST
jgi:predicted nucleotidyltransferase